MRAALSFIFLMACGVPAFAGDLPHVSEAMRSPAFWVQRHPSAESLVMTADGVAAFNEGLQALGLTEDVLNVPAESYGMTIGFTNERMEPTQEVRGEAEFDELQNSGLDPATPVAIMRTSNDGKWFFVKEGISSGWVEKDKVALVEEELWRRMATTRNAVVVTSARTNIYLDQGCTKVAAQARMGSRFILKRVGKMFEVSYPLRNADGTASFVSGFIAKEDAVRGVLPYKAGTVIAQAFKLLDAPYGWGDLNGNQDCSRFIAMAFATVGIILPRNSPEQGLSGISLGEFDGRFTPTEKFTVISKALGGTTLLRLKGHIMLYLGEVDGRLYAIHAMASYRVKEGDKEARIPLMKVVVSDLSLGEGSSKGSLLERVVTVRSIIRHPERSEAE